MRQEFYRSLCPAGIFFHVKYIYVLRFSTVPAAGQDHITHSQKDQCKNRPENPVSEKKHEQHTDCDPENSKCDDPAHVYAAPYILFFMI